MKTLLVSSERFALLTQPIAGTAPAEPFALLAKRVGGDLLTVDGLFRPVANGREYEMLTGADINPAHPIDGLADTANRLSADYRTVYLEGEPLAVALGKRFLKTGKSAQLAVMAANPLTGDSKREMEQVAPLINRIFVSSPLHQLQLELEIPMLMGRIQRIDFAVDHRFYHPAAVERDPRSVIYIGGADRDPGVLLKAVKTGEWRLTLLDVAPEELKDHSLPDETKFAGNVSPAELRQLYQRANAVVLPLIETDNASGIRSALVAMACGAPVIMTRTRGNRHTLINGINGLYVGVGEHQTLQQLLLQLRHNDGLLNKVSSNARFSIEETATLDQYVEHVAQLLDELAWRQPE